METLIPIETYNPTVFLGGTCVKDLNEKTYRDYLIPMLHINFFNPVVDNWTEECQAEELRQRETCEYVLYVITPEMEGIYSIAEVVDDSNKRPEKTLFCFTEPLADEILEDNINYIGFNEKMLKSLKATAKMVEQNGALVFYTLYEIAEFLNKGDK